MMEISRRKFLSLAGALGLAAGLPASAMNLIGAGGMATRACPPRPGELKKGAVKLMDLHRETFEPLIQTVFQVSGDAGLNVSLVLAEVPGISEQSAFEQFSLIFSGPQEPFLPQGTYQFHHSGLGKFALFIVPIGRAPDGFQYQAVFNRLRK